MQENTTLTVRSLMNINFDSTVNTRDPWCQSIQTRPSNIF